MTRNKTSGGKGTNQYQIKGSGRPQPLNTPALGGLPSLDVTQRIEMARNFHTPVEILDKLARDSDNEVRLWTATNPNIPTASLARLAHDTHPNVLFVVAAHPNTAPQDLTTVATCGVDLAVGETGRNPNTPVETLRLLAGNPSAPIRSGVASNPATPAAVLTVLATDPDKRVRLTAARHPLLPPDTLVTLIADVDYEVRQAALMHPQVPRHVKTIAILGGNGLTAQEMAEQAEGNDIMAAVSEFTAAESDGVLLDANRLASWAKHPNRRVRFSLATLSEAPTALLESMTHDADPVVGDTARHYLAARVQSGTV